ncbi:MAG: CooT family nickel-binding protein [Eubacteriaceae bacterium]|nr:CooT family nickel-binding protein [Eubacteriaceae bacterium]
MCLGKAFLETDNNQLSPIMENISGITTENGHVILTSLFGEERTIDGIVKEVDFNSSKIIIKQISL